MVAALQTCETYSLEFESNETPSLGGMTKSGQLVQVQVQVQLFTLIQLQ